MCNKVTYSSREAALLDGKFIQRSLRNKKLKHAKQGKKLIPYVCTVCHKFHLTTTNTKHITRIRKTRTRKYNEMKETQLIIMVLEGMLDESNNSSEPVLN